MLQALDINCILNNSNVKHPEWTTTTTTTKSPAGLKWIWFESHFFLSSLLCLFMQGHNMTDKRVLQASGLPRGETQHKKKKKWAENFSSRLSLPSRHHCVVYCIWKCRLSTYCIYYQPPPALKPAAKTKLWTISEKKKKKNTVVQSELKCFQGIQGFI